MQTRAELIFASRVAATDGDCGPLTGALVDLRDERVAALLLEAGAPGEDPRLVPAGEVSTAADGDVRLRLSRAEVQDLPVLKPHQTTVRLLAGEERRLVESAVYPSALNLARVNTAYPLHERPLFLLGEGQRVHTSDGFSGLLRGLLATAEMELASLVVRVSRAPRRKVIVPADRINELEPTGVYLAVDRERLLSLPDYRLDAEIAADIERALAGDRVLRRIDYEYVDIYVQDGIVRLEGNIAHPTTTARIKRAICAVPGLLGLEDHLVEDVKLQTAVAQAVARHDELRGARIRVGVQHGAVYLTGTVHTPECRELAQQIVERVPGVRTVSNELRVAETGVAARRGGDPQAGVTPDGD